MEAYALAGEHAARQRHRRDHARVARAAVRPQLGGGDARQEVEREPGRRQRVALARALVTEPRVLLLDEPFGALDLKLRKQMQVETKKLQRRLGLTFIFVTHDQEEALTMSDTIGVIDKGQVEQMGDSKEIYERPATKFVAGFIGEANILPGVVQQVQDTSAVVSHELKDKGVIQFRTAGDGLAEGQPLFVSVRPEKVRVGPEAEQCINQFEGSVVDEVYIGLASRVTIQLDQGARITANVQIHNIGESVPIGTRLKVGWDPANSIVVAK